MRRGAIVERFATLVNPGRPIPAEASAVHGICDRDVRRPPALMRIEPRLRTMTRGAVVVAHNAGFDVSFLPFTAKRPVICTMRLAMHLVDAPSYRNQALREIASGNLNAPGRGNENAPTLSEEKGLHRAVIQRRLGE